MDASTQESIHGYPKALFPYVLEFCETLVPSTSPVYVPILPASQGIQDDCFENVRKHILQHGGSSVLGWEVFEWYGLMIEAQLHAVWCDSDNKLWDVSPKPIEATSALFIVDPTVQYEGRQVDNHRHPLTNDKRLVEFIRIAERVFEISNYGDRATQHGEIELSDEEMSEYEALAMRQKELFVQLMQSEPERNHLCRCGSGKKYKKCCYLLKA